MMQPSIRMFTCSYNQTWIRERWESKDMGLFHLIHTAHKINQENVVSSDRFKLILTFCRYLKIRF